MFSSPCVLCEGLRTEVKKTGASPVEPVVRDFGGGGVVQPALVVDMAESHKDASCHTPLWPCHYRV